MDKSIRFMNVAKRYRLGLTRTSLPALVSERLASTFKRENKNGFKPQYLLALDDVSFDLEKGQSLALIGSNGAGKTTILKILANITKQTSGQVEVNGRLSALIELGSGFHPDLTGRENIYLNGSILGLKKREIDDRFDEIVAFSELEDFIDTPLKRYSSGMSVRLGFSVAASIEPEILLVDEVLAVGDASFRQKCVQRIRELINNGTSIVFVSHNSWLVQSICELALYLDHGRVKCTGKTAEVIEVYDRDINEKRARDFKIPDSMQDSSFRDVEITEIEVRGVDGKIKDEFYNDQPIVINVHYLAHKSIGDVNVVVRILRSDGLTCCMLRSKLDEYRFNINQGGGLVSVILDPVQLYGGTYYVHALIRDYDDVETLVNKWSNWFYIKGSMLSHETMNGVFEPKRQWNHSQLTQVQEFRAS